MTDLAVDNFDESGGGDTTLDLHTPDSGAATGWEGSEASSVTVDDTANTAYSSSTCRPILTVTPSSADYYVDMTVNLADSATSNRVGPLLRQETTGNTGYQYRLYGSGLWRLYRIDGGTNPTLSTDTIGSFNAGIDHDIYFSVSGTGATVTLNVTVDAGAIVTDYEDTSGDRITSTNDPGFYLEGGNEYITYYESGYLSAATFDNTQLKPLLGVG